MNRYTGRGTVLQSTSRRKLGPLRIAAAATVVVLLAACGGDTTETRRTPDSPSPTATSPEPSVSPTVDALAVPTASPSPSAAPTRSRTSPTPSTPRPRAAQPVAPPAPRPPPPPPPPPPPQPAPVITFSAVGDCESGGRPRVRALDITSGTCDTARAVSGAYDSAVAAAGNVPPAGPITVADGWSCTSTAADPASYRVTCSKPPATVTFYLVV